MSPRDAALLLLVACLSAGCTRTANMEEQPKLRPLSPSDFFSDRRSARPLPEGVIPHGPRREASFYTGLSAGRPIEELPMPWTLALLERGRQRFEIYCAVCHDRVGTGNGMVVRRGFPHPPSYHIARLRQAPIGHFVEVMARGYGLMYGYGDRVSAEDRWAVAAYIRALQLSENATLADATPAERARLNALP